MGNFAARSIFERDADGPGPPANAGVSRALHQDNDGVNVSLRGAQYKVKHQYGGNAPFRITLRAAT